MQVVGQADAGLLGVREAPVSMSMVHGLVQRWLAIRSSPRGVPIAAGFVMGKPRRSFLSWLISRGMACHDEHGAIYGPSSLFAPLRAPQGHSSHGSVCNEWLAIRSSQRDPSHRPYFARRGAVLRRAYFALRCATSEVWSGRWDSFEPYPQLIVPILQVFEGPALPFAATAERLPRLCA